jgi:hypothetical protein
MAATAAMAAMAASGAVSTTLCKLYGPNKKESYITGLERLIRDKQSSLMGPFVSCK